MDSASLDGFSEALQRMKAELLAEAADQLAAETVELGQSRLGRLSRMDELQNQQIALEAKRRNERRLVAVAGALRRLEAGDYGYCYVCDEDIPRARLEADPTVTRCTQCAD